MRDTQELTRSISEPLILRAGAFFNAPYPKDSHKELGFGLMRTTPLFFW
jgi:hypothetical protein